MKTEEADRPTSIRFKYRYAVFCSFSGGACSCFASRRAFFRSPCRLICAAYRQSSEQYLTLFRVVVKTLPQCSQVSSAVPFALPVILRSVHHRTAAVDLGKGLPQHGGLRDGNLRCVHRISAFGSVHGCGHALSSKFLPLDFFFQWLRCG